MSALRCQVCGHTEQDDIRDDMFPPPEDEWDSMSYPPVIPRENGMILCQLCEDGRQGAEAMLKGITVTVLADGCEIASDHQLEPMVAAMIAKGVQRIMTTTLPAKAEARWN